MEERIVFAIKLVETLENKCVRLWTEDGKIKYKANVGAIQKEELLQLKEYKGEVIEFLDSREGKIKIVENKKERFEPFLLTDVQQSYLMGRKNLFDYGGVACHIYMQLNYEHIEVKRAELIWNKLIAHHEMLRAVVYEEGYQKILEKAPYFSVKDYGDMKPESVQEIMGHSNYAVGEWPYFSVGVSNYANSAVMHFSIEFIIADWTSIWMLLLQFEDMYFGRIIELPDANVSFRDYVIAERELQGSVAYELDKKYWLDKLEDFPSCPQIDVNEYDSAAPVKFERKSMQFTPEEWGKIKQCALDNSITPTALVLMVYAKVLERYSENKRFAINLTVLNRQPIHKDINKIVGDFTSLNLLDVDFSRNESFSDKARRTNAELFENLDHTLYSGVSFMREISRRKNAEEAFMPYVFTSAIGLLSSMDAGTLQGMVTGIGISQTPQVFIDCQVMDGPFGMQVNWDVRKGVFKENIINDMFMLFKEILVSVSEGVELDIATAQEYPKYQEEIFRQANDTSYKLSEHLLHEKIIEVAAANPEKTAIIAEGKRYSYKQLVSIAGAIAEELEKIGCEKGEPIGIVTGKSVYQPAGAIAILSVGGAYVPILIEQGSKRIESIINRAKIKTVLTLVNDETEYAEDVRVIKMDELSSEGSLKCKKINSLEDLAYIIFTSGSTGEPKGVAISHRAAVNTIEDINRRYEVGCNDSVLGASQLNFDLSVYDIFGLLSVGGTLVYPEDSRKKEPAYLAELINENNVTIWNSVPSLLKMVMIYMDNDNNNNKTDISSLRLAFLSGDWIPLDLPEQFLKYAKMAQVVSLGGATEASIWSNYHNYNGLLDDFASIPYGKPLANQEFRVLDSNMRNCPVGVKGELYILGKGLAEGYYNDEKKTAEQFVDSCYTSEHMYRTGDIGKYHENGEIEFLGRIDSQIKFNGHRIELGEIAHAVESLDFVEKSAVVFADNGNEKSIVCYYETKAADELQKSAYLSEFREMLCGDFRENGLYGFIRNYVKVHNNARIIFTKSETVTEDIECVLEEKSVSKYMVDDIENFVMDVTKEDNSFDVIFLEDFITDLTNINKFAKSIRRLIKVGGYLVITNAEMAKMLCSTDSLKNERCEECLGTMIMQVKTDKNSGCAECVIAGIKEKLTSYMIPQTFCMLDNIPVTANGKTDMKALRTMAMQRCTSFEHHKNLFKNSFTDTQNNIRAIWEGFGISGLELTDNFFDFGADSLIMARVTGKLREEMVQEVSFDELLRFIFNHPTIMELSEFVEGNRDETSDSENNSDKHIGHAQLYEAGDGPLRVVFHPALGTMTALRLVVSEMVKQQKGNIMTITINDVEKYCTLEAENAVSILADDYTQLILDTGCTSVQLVGYSFGGWLATQCANRLIEAGIEIEDLIFIDPQTIPWDIEDGLMKELMFLPNFGIALPMMSSDTSAEDAFSFLIEKYGKIPSDSVDIMLKEEKFTAFGSAMKRLSELTYDKRFELYTELLAENYGEKLDSAMLKGFFDIFNQTTKYTKGEMETYFGNVRYINAKDSVGVFYGAEKNLSYWSDICIGDMDMYEIEGDHYSCVEKPENAKVAAEIIGDFKKEV